MSFYIIPSSESSPFGHRHPSSGFGRCGSSARSGFSDPISDLNAIPRSLLSAFLGPHSIQDDIEVDGDDDDDDLEFTPFASWQSHAAEQLRRQEYQREIQRRQRVLQARRREQQLLEQERQRIRERAQRERERLARLAWHQEQQRRALEKQRRAAILEYQQRAEAYQQRQQAAYAERARAAAASRYEPNWEHAAVETLFGVINLAQQLFGGENEPSGKKDEKANVPVEQEKKDHEMEVDAQPTEQADTLVEQVATKETSTAPSSTVEAPVEENSTPSTEKAPIDEKKSTENKKGRENTDRLLFTYPLPADESVRSNIRAEDIQVSFDTSSRTVTLGGLWHNDNTASDAGSSTAGSDQGGSESTSRGRKRSRSPKHSRVSDYDEKTGEEIPKPDDADKEEYVEVNNDQMNKTPVTKTIRLQEGVNVEGLRAEITDQGFQVWVH